MVFKEENPEPCNWRAAKEVVNTALRKGSRLVLSWCPYSLGAGYQTDVTLLSGIPPELLKRMFQVKGTAHRFFLLQVGCNFMLQVALRQTGGCCKRMAVALNCLEESFRK